MGEDLGATPSCARTALRQASNHVLHAVVPFHLGGQADVLIFPNHIVDATLNVAAELTGRHSAVSNSCWEQYELTVGVRGSDNWPQNAISRLATYCLDTPLKSGETMDIASAVPQPCAVFALLFAKYGDFLVEGRNCGVLRCIGITAEELEACFELGSTVVFASNFEAGVFPFTDLAREAVTRGAA